MVTRTNRLLTIRRTPNRYTQELLRCLLLLCLGILLQCVPSMAADLVYSNYQIGDLRLQYQPPENDGGEQITKYKIEWDALSSANALSGPYFTPLSRYYGSTEVVNIREVQEIIVSCRSSCSGSFSLSWGGRITDVPLRVDATSSQVKSAIDHLLGPFITFTNLPSAIQVNRKANGFAYKWSVTFMEILGNVGSIKADGDLLTGGGATVQVYERRSGLSDLYPGAYTNEIQTVSVRKRKGFSCETLSGSFSLSFEGKVTPSINVDASSEEFKELLESLETIHTVNVRTDHYTSRGDDDCSSRSWIVTFTHLVHESRQGAGDIGIMQIHSSTLDAPSVTQLEVYENIKGTNPRAFNLIGLQYGLTYHCRVTAYNALGFGRSSTIVSAIPKTQPLAPNDATLSLPDSSDDAGNQGTSLLVSWSTVHDNGGDPVTDYKLEWYSAVNDLEVQQLTTSSSDGVKEVQSIKVSADTNSITGFFTLTFKEETTELIAHDADAEGEESIEAKLERLSSVGDVEVSREYSWVSIPNLMFYLTTGSNVISKKSDDYSDNLVRVISIGEIVNVGGEVHKVVMIDSTSLIIDAPYSGPSAASVFIHKWSFGYQWFITFTSHIGKQPLLIANPANSWAGTNPMIQISRIREGLRPLSGMLRLGFEGERTLFFPVDASAELVKQALESLKVIGEVSVERVDNKNGHNYLITFLSELGNVDQITVDDSQLNGPDVRARVTTLVEGKTPFNYHTITIPNRSSSVEYQINDLENGLPYFVRIRSGNSKGFGYAEYASPSSMAPMRPPSPPTAVKMFPLSQTRIRISWQSPIDNGGSPIVKYVLQWDVDSSFPSASIEGFNYEKFVKSQDGTDVVYCHTFMINPSSSSVPRFGRVMAFNGYKWNEIQSMSRISAIAAVGAPGPVRNFKAISTSSIGIVLEWSHPFIDDEESCSYAGDGGSAITHYVIEYDEDANFSSPASSITTPPTSTAYCLGGRDTLSGSTSPVLRAGGTYYVRIVPFNSLGQGVIETFPSAIGPLTDKAPSAPVILDAVAVSASSVQVTWDTPAFDGGSVIQEYVIEYDTEPSFGTAPKNTSIAVVSDVRALQLVSSASDINVHSIQATVAVRNEVQSVKVEVTGVDEVQEITTTCDDVTAEVQMIATTAIDTNEEQVITLMADDIDEIQLLRLQGDSQVEIQLIQVSVQRVHEVQKLGIVITNINTDGDGVHSTACMGLTVGDPCSDIENALSGSFIVSFDFDECGSGAIDSVNYCQLALSKYDSNLGTIVCRPGLVRDPFLGGDHCVSTPVTHSFESDEGDLGTLQQVLNALVDDNGISFMTSSNLPGKHEAVSVVRQGRIRKKGSCTLDPSQKNPALCSGEYELSYEIIFDAVHSSGDVPPVTVVTSTFEIDTTSDSFANIVCPRSLYNLGCEKPIGAAFDSDHGSFYSGESGSVAIEFVKGAQPTSAISLDYECESAVVCLLPTFSMTISDDGMSATFDSEDFVSNIQLGQFIRFSAGDGLDHYRKVTLIDSDKGSVTFDSQAPEKSAIYTDVEYGDYFSDWAGASGNTGISSHCMGSRIHSTLPIDVDVHNPIMSVMDWKEKIGALYVIDASGVDVSRYLVSDLTNEVGLVWGVTFQKQPGNVHEMTCNTLTGNAACFVSTQQDSSIIGGSFTLQTMWPHEYVAESPLLYETDAIRWNSDETDLKNKLESIIDSNNDKVFGIVRVSRTPYIPQGHVRWSGGYLWAITFMSRGGNIPALLFDDMLIIGTNAYLSVSDEDSGESDLFQGQRNSAMFSDDDPGLARDGNQITGSYSFFWFGNAYHNSVLTNDVFSVQTGGYDEDQYTALSAENFKSLFEEHVLGSVNKVDVIRSELPTQWMGFSYTIIFRHEDVGGDVPQLIHILESSLGGINSYVQVDESIKGSELFGTFQLRFDGETSRPINYDASAEDVQDALNELSSIAPSSVIVSGGVNPVRYGPPDGSGGMSTQVGGRIWYVTFASNVWKDPTIVHDMSFIPGNWVGLPAKYSDEWSSGFSKAWGKNVGNVPMISCLQSGLSTTNGPLPENSCSVSEIITGTDPLGGTFKICLDSKSNPNGVMSIKSDSCTEFIAHNAVASAAESGGDGSSMEEKLERLDNVGNVRVTRSNVNKRNGGYTWKVQFLHDVDGPCEQKDDISSLCNSPGNVQKFCDSSRFTSCDTNSLKGTCLNPVSCRKLNVLDANDKNNGLRFPGGNEKQAIIVKDDQYLGWEDGSIVDRAVSKEYRLIINEFITNCIKHNALSGELMSSIQMALDEGIGGSVRVDRTRSEDIAENGFIYYLTFYDTEDIPLIAASFSTGICSNDFEPSQSVVVLPISDGSLHTSNCHDCLDGVVQRGYFQTFEVAGDSIHSVIDWNAEADVVKSHLEHFHDRRVRVTRTVLDKYGTIEWMVTFTENAGMTPPGSGDVAAMIVTQDPDTSGRSSHITVKEIVKGSDGLSGTFILDYQGSHDPRTFSFEETSERMQRKLEEMTTIGRVFVDRDCYPSCSSGGWGGNPVAPGSIGGYQWKIYFLNNPGSNNGFTFPPGSGLVHAPSIDHALLRGQDATVTTASFSVGSPPLTGTFRLTINGGETGLIPYNIDSFALEQTINDLDTVGDVSVDSNLQSTFLIPGVSASVVTDGGFATSVGDLRKFLSPGDFFRLGGSIDLDGAEYVGSASLVISSPILTNVQLINRNHIYVGEKIRIASRTFSVARNGVEVQQLTVHRSSDITDGDAYQLRVTIRGVTETTSCLPFDASAAIVQTALNRLSVFIDNDSVLVTRSERTSGIIGDAHFYKIYFIGDQVIGDVEEMLPEKCSLHIPPGMNSTNSHFHIRTLMQGGTVEHQRISLASDSGYTTDTPAFQLKITDTYSNSWTSPCFEWGIASLDISSMIDVDVFSTDTVEIKSVADLGNGRYKVESSSFVEGIVLIGDVVNSENKCSGQVLSIDQDGKSMVIEAISGCSASNGDYLNVGSDVSMIDAFINNGKSVSEVTMISMFSDSEVKSLDGLYKIKIDFNGVSRSTSCLHYGASATIVQREIGSLFDFNKDGFIDLDDEDHIEVIRKGDGKWASGYGYTYEIRSIGSRSMVGPSSVLGSNAPKFSIVDIGSDSGCIDSGIEDSFVTNDASTIDGSKTISLDSMGLTVVRAGAKLRASSSLPPSKVYTVDHIDLDSSAIILNTNFEGWTSDAVTLYLIRGGSPQFNVEIIRGGLDEYAYDIFFTGSHWNNIPEVQVNTFGDGACGATASDINNGMNRNINVKTLTDGGGVIELGSKDYYVLDGYVHRGEEGLHDLYVVPPMFRVHADSTEEIQIIVMDVDSGSIWHREPSYKLSFKGEFTNCLAYNAMDIDIENALNSLDSICRGVDPCVTVTRRKDSVQAPNGYIYTLYIDLSIATDIDFNTGRLEADASHPDCQAFDPSNGEFISIETIVQGKSSPQFSADQVPFGGVSSHWIGESEVDLPVYIVSGTYWFLRFEQSLSTVEISVSQGSLPSESELSVDHFFTGSNPNNVIIQGLHTGIDYFYRVFARNNIALSLPSNTISAIPSGKPEKIPSITTGYALHRQEVQSVTVAATHQSEIQEVKTSAIPIPEVQEIVLRGSEVSDMGSYMFSLRHPEIQVVKWSSESPVVSGSFFLKLLTVDHLNSNLSGAVVYKEMKSSCIDFDATADELKRAIETDATSNGLGADSVRVTRSRNRSISSYYGYTYRIHFVGGNVRGNVLQFTSDLALTGLDSSGGFTCDAFVSTTNDASLQIWTENESRALGTDTPRAEIILNNNTVIVDGDFQISVTYFGRQITTECIPWGASARQVELALENLDNVDSVHVVRAGQGKLSNEGAYVPLHGVIFKKLDDITFIASPRFGLWDVLFVDDLIQFSGQRDPNTFYRIVSLIDDKIVIDNPLDGDSLTYYVSRFFCFKYIVYFDGNAMHIDDNGTLGFRVMTGSNFIISESGSCTSLQSIHNNVVKMTNEIPGAVANVRILSRYDGGHNLLGAETNESQMHLSKTLLSSLPMIISEAHVTQSLATSKNGFSFTITYGIDDGDVPLVFCNYSPNMASLQSCSVNTIMDGNEISGTFYLESSDPIPFNASANEMETAINGIHGMGNVKVNRSDGDRQGGFIWTITFIDKHGDIPNLRASNSLIGKGATVSVSEVVKGNQLEGFFSLSYESESTDLMPYNSDTETIKAALEKLSAIRTVDVNMDSAESTEQGRTYTITFRDPNIGDAQLLDADTSQLTGLGGVVSVFEVVKGSLASRDALYLSFDFPMSCSNSDVKRAFCGDYITQAEFQFGVNDEFSGSTKTLIYHPSLRNQIIRTSYPAPVNQITGYFNVAYDGFYSDPLNAQATANHVRIILEQLPGINTVKVKRDYSSTEVSGVCIDLTLGSSTVRCSLSCSPCNFRSRGIIANSLLKIEGKWFRVSSTYDGTQESFSIASTDDSYVHEHYSGVSNLSNRTLQSWAGGFEWTVSLFSVLGEVKPFSTPVHHLSPSQASIDISLTACDKCVYMDSLHPGTNYYIRGRVKNKNGYSVYSDVAIAAPRGIPTAPIILDLDAVSGACLEVSFQPPIYGEPITSYVIQWDRSETFAQAEDVSASCTSFRYGRCVIVPQRDLIHHKHEFCGLLDSDIYHVRVAAINDVRIQSIYPSGSPKDNTNWSSIISTRPENQPPDPPLELESSVLGRNAIQILFDWPARDGGQNITHFVITYDTSRSFFNASTVTIASTIPKNVHANSKKFLYNFVPTNLQLIPGIEYFIKLASINSVGRGKSSPIISVVPSGPSDPPMNGVLSTLQLSASPINEATVSWTPPTFNGGYPINGYMVEWWSQEKRPEVQIVRLQYNLELSATTFTLSFSPSPTRKKVTSSLPWNAPAALVRRELLNLGWDESQEPPLLSDIVVTRTKLSKGCFWTVTFGNNPETSTNDGDQVSLVAKIMPNGDLGSPSISVSTSFDGQRSNGIHEVQYLQIVGKDTLTGHYRMKFSGSEWTSFIPVHADADCIKRALEQLSTLGEVDVIQNDGVNPTMVGTGSDIVHHYEIHFIGNPGNVEPLVIDLSHLSTADGSGTVLIYDGDNELDNFNSKMSATIPGEMPLYYNNSGYLVPLSNSYHIKGLKTGVQYFVAVSAISAKHGLSKKLIPNPASITPPLQTPGIPKDVNLIVNKGFSDSLLVRFKPPDSTGGSEILYYRVELDPTESFDNPIAEDFLCPASNKRTEWEVKTSVDGDSVITGGSFKLNLEVNGFTFTTSEIPYDAVPLATNEIGMSEEMIPIFSTVINSNLISTVPPTDIERILFPGDRLRFSGQSTINQYYEVFSVTGTNAILSDYFVGNDGVQVSTTRHYGGRGTPSSSRIHCQFHEDLCPITSVSKSGSLESKLEDLTQAVRKGVHVHREGPNEQNGFLWRVTFMDDAYPSGSDYELRVNSNSLHTARNQGSAQIFVRLMSTGMTYSECSGSLVVPSSGGLVKGLNYYGRVSARNSEGYSLPVQAPGPISPMVVPGAPTGVTVDVISATVLRVIFSPPSDNGGDSITQYLIEWSTSSTFMNVNSTTLDYLSSGSPFFKDIQGLVTGTYYFVRVKAKNSQGYSISQVATPSSINPHQKPSPPTNVRLGITSNTMLTVGWEPPASNGGDSIAQYRVEWDTHPGFSSASSPPNKGYVHVFSATRSYTIEFLSPTKNYYLRVYAINSSGASTPQTSTPTDARPTLQVPGCPHSLQASPNIAERRIDISWQRPKIPQHDIACYHEGDSIKDCPTPYGGTLPSSDGGDTITEYELEYNERNDFLGMDGGRKKSINPHIALDNLYSRRVYYIRILARNSIGSGKYSMAVRVTAP